MACPWCCRCATASSAEPTRYSCGDQGSDVTKNHRLSGILAIAAAATMWGTVGPVVQLFPEGTAFQYATLRNVFGVIALWIMVGLSKDRRRYEKRDVFPILVGGIGTACFMPMYTLGFQRTGVAVASMLAIGAAPLFTGLLGRVAFGRRPERNWFIGTGLAVIGIAALNAPSEGTTIKLAGALFSLGAAFSYTLQATGMEMSTKRLSAVQCVAPIWTIGMLLQAPLVIGRDFSFLSDPILLAGVVYGGIFTVAISFSMFTWGIARVGAATAVTVGLMEPITTATLGVTVLGEHLPALGFVGIVFVLAGLLVVSRASKTPPIVIEP